MRSRSALFLIAGLATSAGALEAQPVPRLPSVAEVRLYARLMAMTDARTFDSALVDSALASSWAPLRAAATLGIGQVGSSHGMPGARRLRTLLDDRDLTVASNAAYALGLLRDSAGVPALAAVLSTTPRVAREAAWALGEIGAPARAAILEGMARPGSDDGRIIQLLLAAAKMRPVPVAELRQYLLMSYRPSVVWAASYAIARFRAPAGVRDLLALATDPAFLAVSSAEMRPLVPARSASASRPATADVYVASAAGRQRAKAEIARGLTLQATGDSLDDAAVAVLLRLVADPHPHVRINAVRSLATYGVRGREAVVAAAGDRDANVRIAAAQSLGTVLDSMTRNWSALWARDTSLMYRSSLLGSAARVEARLPELSTWTTHRDWKVRAAALNAVGASTDQPFIARVAGSMLRDPDGRVRATAYGMLTAGDTAVPAPGVHDALVDALSDRDFVVRATVLGTLSRHAIASDVPAVITAYAASKGDASNDARIAAVRHFARAWRRDSASFTPVLRQQLIALRPAADPLERAEAESASVFSAWPSRSGSPRPLSWYRNVVRAYVVPALRGRPQVATIRTRRGDIVLELFGADAPITVRNFMYLARTGYYRGTGFHRVVPNFVAQDGDPRDDGNGGPGYAIRDEMNPRRYDRGAVGMALSGPDTGGSQYFIAHSPQPHLDGHYTVFGRVLRGFGALDAVVQGDRILAIVVQ